MNVAMTDSTYLILLSLLDEKHGYAIMKTIEEATQGQLKIGPASMYTILKKLVDHGDILLKQDIKRRKTYVITSQGLEKLEAEIGRRQLFVDVGYALLKGKSAKKIINECIDSQE